MLRISELSRPTVQDASVQVGGDDGNWIAAGHGHRKAVVTAMPSAIGSAGGDRDIDGHAAVSD